MTQKLKIRFNLSSNLTFPANKPIRPIQFDGVLGIAWKTITGRSKTPAELIPENLILPELPLELIDNKFYAASAGFTAPNSFFKPTLYNRSADLIHTFDNVKTGAVANQTSVGIFQSAQEPYWELFTEYVDFYARVIDLERLRYMLDIIKHIGTLGAKKSTASGRIYSIEITKAENDYSLWKDGQPTRPIPVSSQACNFPQPEQNLLIKDFCSSRPPYWSAILHEECYISPTNMHLPNLPIIHNNLFLLEQKLTNFYHMETKKQKKEQRFTANKSNKVLS